MRVSRAFFRASKSLACSAPWAFISLTRLYLFSMSSSYWRIFTSTCWSSREILTSRLSIFSSSPSRFCSSPSRRFCVVSELRSALLLKSSSSSISRMWPSGDRSGRISVALAMLTRRRSMLSCLSLSLFSSSAWRRSKLSMNDVISWSLEKRISYFCWSLCMSVSLASEVTSWMAARRRSFISLMSELDFSVATISALSLFTLARRRSRCSGMLRLHCLASVSSFSRISCTSRRLESSICERARITSLRRWASRVFRRPLTWSSSSRLSPSSWLRWWLSSRSISYSRCWSGCSSLRRSSAARASERISSCMCWISSSWPRFSRKTWSTSARCWSFCCFMSRYMWFTSSGRVSVRCLSVARLWSARSPSSERTVFTSDS
mmetsp:Transcript_45899/g.118740  ORF Transcript_45899/g.118740 Transcript_45899/m.118740 type:complete len:378 (+) Transcript_45899:251-1384(+)